MTPTSPAEAIRTVLARLGGHESGPLGLDLDRPGDRARWLVAARLAAERDPEERRHAAYRVLASRLGTSPDALARAGVERVARILDEARLKRPGPLAAGLVQAARALVERPGRAGSAEEALEALADAALDLDGLGSELVALAPGLGAATVLRFLRPLRTRWRAAAETPLAEPARAAAVHLGLLGEWDDPESAPTALARACEEVVPDRALTDIEAALERLGARACRRGRVGKCPLADACPARDGSLE